LADKEWVPLVDSPARNNYLRLKINSLEDSILGRPPLTKVVLNINLKGKGGVPTTLTLSLRLLAGSIEQKHLRSFVEAYSLQLFIWSLSLCKI